MNLIEKIGVSIILITASTAASAVALQDVGTVPEPSTWALLAIGAMGVFFASRKK